MDKAVNGKAFLRTNLGKGFVQRREVIARNFRKKGVGSAQDWHDIPMIKIAADEFAVDIALTEVGHYEGMCCFFPDDEIRTGMAG